MRGLVERRCLSIAVTRARGPSCTRKLSGIGRGYDDGREAGPGRRRGNQFSNEDTDEPLFPVGGGAYGHGAPVNSVFTGGGRPGIGADLGDEAAHQNVARSFAGGSAGRGSTGYKLGQMVGTGPDDAGPLLPDISMGRGSSPHRPTSEDSLFSDQKTTMPKLSLGLGGFGRGKAVQNEVRPEDSFSEGHRKVLPKWDETIKKIEDKDNALRAEELKQFEDARIGPVLGFPGPPVAPTADTCGPRLVQSYGQDFSSRNVQSTGPAFGFSQQARASSDPNRFVPREEVAEADKGNNVAQASRPSTLPGWQLNAVSGGLASGQVGEPSTSTYDPASPPHSHFSQGAALHHVSSGQPSRPRFPAADAVRQAPQAFPGLASSTSKPHDSSRVESLHRADTQAVPTFPGLATAATNPYDTTHAGRQVYRAFPGLATARGQPHDDTKRPSESSPGLPQPYDNTYGKPSYTPGKQAAPTFFGSPTSKPRLQDSTKGEYDIGRQIPPTFPGLATATGEPYDKAKGESQHSVPRQPPPAYPRSATVLWEPHDVTEGESYYSGIRQVSPAFSTSSPGRAAASWEPHDNTKGDHHAGRQVSPAFPGLGTVRGNPYENTKGQSYDSVHGQSPLAFPGSATSSFELHDRSKEGSYYSGVRQASPVSSPTFPGTGTASWKPYDNTKVEHDVGMHGSSSFLGTGTASRNLYENTKGEYDAGIQAPSSAFPGLATDTGKPYHSVPRQSSLAFPGSATASSETYDSLTGGSYYSGVRPASPTFSPSLAKMAAALWEPYDDTQEKFDVGKQGSLESPGLASAVGKPYDDPRGESYNSVHRQSPQSSPGAATVSSQPYGSSNGESYHGGVGQASPVFSPPGMSEFYGDVASQASLKPAGSAMGQTYVGSRWPAAPSARVTLETEGAVNMPSSWGAPPTFSASGIDQFQYDTSGQPIDSAFSGIGLGQDASPLPYQDESYYQEGWRHASTTEATPDSSQQTAAEFQQTEGWYSDMSSHGHHEGWPTPDSTQYFSQQTQAQDGHDSGHWQPPWSASASSEYIGDSRTPEANEYDYDWIRQSPESTGLQSDASDQFLAEKSPHFEVGSDYDERIEECYLQGRLEIIGTIYDEMKAAQVQASPKTYDTLMQTFMKLGKSEKVSQVYQEMREVIMPAYVKTHKPAVEDDTMRKPVKDVEKPSTFPSAGGTEKSGHGASEERAHSEVKLETNVNTEEQPRQTHDQGGGSTMSTDQFVRPDERLPGFLPFGMQKSLTGLGAGRGKKVAEIFDFASSHASGLGRGQPQPELKINSPKTDDYSETFRPVIRPELQYAFAPEGLSGGPGAGRGRPLSPQSSNASIGRVSPPSPQTVNWGVGRGRSTSPPAYDTVIRSRIPHFESSEAAAQSQQPLDIEDTQGEFQSYPQDQFRPALSREEAGERAMQILDERLNRKLRRMEEWSRYDDEDSASVRRTTVRLPQTRAPKEKRQLVKFSEQEKEVQPTEEQAKEEAARMKAMEQNEQIEELQHTLSQFMKNYGEIGLELEYLMGDFMSNPDIDEKPLPPLEEYLEQAKPNIMKTGIIRSEGEWQRMVKDVLRNASYFEEFVEQYSGPGRYTAKQENEDLEAIAKTLPLDAGPKFQSAIQRCLTTLKSNPGFNLDEKQWMLSNMVDELFELSQYEDYRETASSRSFELSQYEDYGETASSGSLQ